MPSRSARPAPNPPLDGAYYWLPTPTTTDSISWSLVTCHDVRLWDGISHREFWPSMLERLAPAWGKDPVSLKRRLGDHYYALPRGRVTRPGGKYLILHGNDAPAPAWRTMVVDRFRLHGLQVKTPRDEHEQALRDDVLALEEALGVDMGLPGV
jgi:hypothetical protein